MDFIASLLLLAFFEAAFYAIYKLVVAAANRVVKTNFTDLRKEIVDGDISEKGVQIKLKVKDWFNWNIQTNNEKGTAGGNIKINFPIKSALVVAFICFILCALSAVVPVTAFLVPAILFSFGIYYLIKWWSALQLVKNIQDWFTHSEIYGITQRRLYRSNSSYVLGGVCTGLSEYTGINLGITRILFLVGAIASSGIGVIAYILMWLFVPIKPQ